MNGPGLDMDLNLGPDIDPETDLQTDLDTVLDDEATPEVVLLPQPRWWIDRNDAWEISHHPTREDAEADHADRVRGDHGRPLSVAGAFALVYGTARQEHQRCWEWTCPDCGCGAHSQERIADCPHECGFEFLIDQIAPDVPDQTHLFEVLPTHDLPGQPLSRVVVFADEDP
jgi:hypothetical protein